MAHDFIVNWINETLPELAGATVERMAEGGSTEVYRIRTATTTYYLRLLPEIHASFAPEAVVHRQLRAAGVYVPSVFYFAQYSPPLQRSVLITGEVPGQALGYGDQHPQCSTIVRSAGRDLAKFGQITVEGFGWVDRSSAEAEPIRAEFASFAAWMTLEIDNACSTLATSQLLSASELANIRILADELIAQVGDRPAVLAHGDFDVTHIYHQGGVYSGIIDFGEVRGTNSLYDLGHFQMENHELLPDLLAGYQEVRPLPSDALQEIIRTGLLIAVSRLANMIRKGRNLYPPYVAAAKRNLVWLTG